MSTTSGPRTDAEIAAYLEQLGLPGVADVHVHFLPEPMLAKVWDFFDRAEQEYGTPWPIRYRFDEDTRLATLRSFGVRAIPALVYPHKPGMAQWLNDWCAGFARRVPDGIHCGTLYPEPEVGEYVAAAIAGGARLFKMHVQVGVFAPDDALLDPAWELLSERRIPVVLHAGSGPVPGPHTGPSGVARLLAKHPGLTLVIAHLGLPEYDEFADLAERYERVHLDTTMAATDFTEAMNPMPKGYPDRLAALDDKVVFGTDYPNIPYEYAHQIEALTRLDLGDAWMRKVLWHNGERLLGQVRHG
ncbi:amidohydrolase family protein [Tsukamurella sp. 8F]|uniref:amidohydrolase family protein n=1 Tax=unclassified Tsukamurella TaxID=2633480 RepID=UPI0023B95CF7|nr:MULTISPECIES: amidohydrolase family protein [unclassified Tsukamurella]MDF0532480.1 amidohydrolase family protein [Tsukamurella sp. 8J]MDF0589319.1 amidohydrolase family protein [Tsukamurella sp. 8F]